jgi:transcriptional regulator with XRE-family HTH domain
MGAVRPVRSDLAATVGARVRDLREDRGLSLSELAARAGVGKGTLSEVETGRRNPTIETLFALTTVLGVPISAVLPAGEVSQRPAEPLRGEAIEAVLVDRFVDSVATTELYRITIPAGRHQDSAPHAPGVTEHWIVYAGTVLMGPHDELVRVGPNETATFTADVPHSYDAEGGADVAATLVVRYPSGARS